MTPLLSLVSLSSFSNIFFRLYYIPPLRSGIFLLTWAQEQARAHRLSSSPRRSPSRRSSALRFHPRPPPTPRPPTAPRPPATRSAPPTPDRRTPCRGRPPRPWRVGMRRRRKFPPPSCSSRATGACTAGTHRVRRPPHPPRLLRPPPALSGPGARAWRREGGTSALAAPSGETARSSTAATATCPPRDT